MKQKKKGKISGNILDSLGAGLLGNLFAGKGSIRADECTIRAGKEI